MGLKLVATGLDVISGNPSEERGFGVDAMMGVFGKPSTGD